MKSVRRGLLAAALVTLSCGSGPTVVAGPDGLGVLFIGNSLTLENNLPGILSALFDSAGVEARVESVTFGGWGLQDHWASGPARETIARGGWDVVIVQQGPSATEGRPSLLEFSPLFAGEAEAVGARLGLYMVWPAEARSFDFQGVSDSYRMAAEAVDGLLFPVGEAWLAAWRRDPSLPLYGGDAFHPSAMGSYLAALVMFEQLSGHSVFSARATLDLPTAPGVDVSPLGENIDLPPAVARLLQEAAHEANGAFARR